MSVVSYEMDGPPTLESLEAIQELPIVQANGYCFLVAVEFRRLRSKIAYFPGWVARPYWSFDAE